MNIRRICTGDGTRLREVRLRALRADPDAFGSTYEEAASRESAWWEDRIIDSATGNDQFLAVVENGEEFIGLIGAYTPAGRPDVRHLVSTWVAPEARGRGLGMELVETVVEWAKAAGAAEVRLWVVDENRPAIALYETAGFVPTGDKQPLPSNPSLVESRMALSLS